MKNSPLQLDVIRYSDVVIRAVPEVDLDEAGDVLPVQVEASIFYGAEGEHFATVSINQKDDAQPYLIEIAAFAAFRIDPDGCREAYKAQFNPAVVGVNVARLLYSSARDMIASITARAPYEIAKIPTLIIEPRDISLHFESEQEEAILRTTFGFTDEQMARIKERKAELDAAEHSESTEKTTKKRKGN